MSMTSFVQRAGRLLGLAVGVAVLFPVIAVAEPRHSLTIFGDAKYPAGLQALRVRQS